MAEAAAVYPPLEARPLKNTICLFDVDKTLTPARGVSLCAFSPSILSSLDFYSISLCGKVSCSIPMTNIFRALCIIQTVAPEMLQLLSQLRHKCAIGFVSCGHPQSILQRILTAL
ncbi:phosphomannomutase [Histoplasma capsulatum]|uniref:Phosphomannomutase n=1 Tax=Ajellomyces capsulatus TaxID=5037 RepID=A0A8A1MCP6_AJECA|nr:phosphomannomutase [Histoplasma capsulatum]